MVVLDLNMNMIVGSIYIFTYAFNEIKNTEHEIVFYMGSGIYMGYIWDQTLWVGIQI